METPNQNDPDDRTARADYLRAAFAAGLGTVQRLYGDDYEAAVAFGDGVAAALSDLRPNRTT